MGQKLEKILVGLLDKHRLEKGLDDRELSEAAFSNQKDARKVFGQLRDGYRTEKMSEKRRKMTVSEFYELCRILDQSPSELIAVALHQLKESPAGNPHASKKLPRANHF